MKNVLLGFLILFCIPAFLKATPANDLYQAGTRLYQQGRLEEAANQFQAAIQLDPTLWQAYQGQGSAYYQLGQKDKALASFEASLKYNPNNPALKALVDQLRPSALPLAASGEAQEPVALNEPKGTLKGGLFNVALQMGVPLLFGPKVGISPIPQLMLSAGGLPFSSGTMIWAVDLRGNLYTGKKRPYIFVGYAEISQDVAMPVYNAQGIVIDTHDENVKYPLSYFGVGYEHVAYSGFGISFEFMSLKFKEVDALPQNVLKGAYGASLNLRRYF